jgi:hypothetical protein
MMLAQIAQIFIQLFDPLLVCFNAFFLKPFIELHVEPKSVA